jgi:hypothetical protein
MPRIRTATENQAAQLVDELRADVARLERNYAVLQELLAEVSGTIAGLCERINGPHADREPYDDETTYVGNPGEP